MAEYRNPDSVAGLEDILKTRQSVDRDQRLRELVAGLAKERDTLKENLSVVEDKGFVLVLGDEDLKKQVTDLKSQLRVLQIATDTYKEDFQKERDDRASAQGAKEDFKIAKEKAEEENRKLKQRLNDSTTRPKVSGADCGKRSPESSTRCRQLLKQVHHLEGQVQQLERQLERAQTESIELNELKCHQKEQEQYTRELEEERNQLRQQVGGSHNDATLLSRSNGRLPPTSPAVRGSRPVRFTNIGGENIPVYNGDQYLVQDKPIPMHRYETFPRIYNCFESDDGPPIRAVDPGLVRSEGGVPIHLLGQYRRPVASSPRPSDMFVGKQGGNLSPSTPPPHTDATLESSNSPIFSGSFDETSPLIKRQPQWPYNSSNSAIPQQQPNIHTVNPHQQGAQMSRNLPLHFNHPGGAGTPSPNTYIRSEQPRIQSPSQPRIQSPLQPRKQSPSQPRIQSPPALPPKQRPHDDYPNFDRDHGLAPALHPKPTGNFQSRQLVYSTPQREEIAAPPLPPKLTPKPMKAENENIADHCESKGAQLENVNAPPSHIVATGSAYNVMLEGLGGSIVEGRDSRSRHTNKHAPLDPNLVCPVCKKEFRINETQKCRAHVRHCLGERGERVQEWNQRMAGSTEPFSQQHSSKKTSPTAEQTRTDTEDSPSGHEKTDLVSRGAGDDVPLTPPKPIPRKRSKNGRS